MRELRFEDMAHAARALAEDIARHLRAALAKHAAASLVLSGGRSPRAVLRALKTADLDWQRVLITLSDERLVRSDSPDSNAQLVQETLLSGRARAATFVPLFQPSDHDPRSHTEARLASFCWPATISFLGMGEDGHIASIFPGPEAGQRFGSLCTVTRAPTSPHARLSLTPPALLNTHRVALLLGPSKMATFEAAKRPGRVEDYPVRLLLHQERVPVDIYCVPHDDDSPGATRGATSVETQRSTAL